MTRYKLKKGGAVRKKAFLGEAISAGAILTAAAMNVAATTKAADTQAKAMKENAKTQAASIKAQTENNNNLQTESIEFTKQQNEQNRQQQQDIQTTLQMLAGQQNMNDRLEQSKVAVKYGGKPKKNLKAIQPFYGGGNTPFKVTDGGGAAPVQIDGNGYGLYELFGNDHEHYHKTPSGKHKSGVGIKFSNGAVVEGEGNQNSNQGELLYVTPDDAMFISKHSIDGFNPTQAVKDGMHPEEAFNIQEQIKAIKGYNDDGSKKRKSIKRAKFGSYFDVLSNNANLANNPSNITGDVASGVVYLTNPDRIKNKCGGKISIKKCGGRIKARGGYSILTNPTMPWDKDYNNSSPNNSNQPLNNSINVTSGNNFWDNYGGAIVSGGANILSAGIGILGNVLGTNAIKKANNEAAQYMIDAYNQMHGIDEDFIKESDYAAPHTMAVVRSPYVNINPQLERLRRNAAYERNETNRGTISSAAQQQRLAGINDRMYQRTSEQYAAKQNAEEQIKQQNAQTITQTAQSNADRDVQAKRDFTNARLSLKQYNNNIENQKLAGIGQVKADNATGNAQATASMWQNSANLIGGALTGTGQGFANSIEANRTYNRNLDFVLAGADTNNVVNFAIRSASRGDKSLAKALYDSFMSAGDQESLKYARSLMPFIK